ncbi:MAG TPA: alpha/beta fold hydrolase [Bacteroidota bacterium]|nr:alpha/beta fold hydrolase [Bacteroidota bacterium]
MTLFFGLILILFLFIVAATIIMLVIGPRLLLEPRRRTEEFYRALGKPVSPKELNLPYEEFTISTGDGLKLESWLIRARGKMRGTIIYLHGVADCKIDGLQFAEFMHAEGYNVLLYDSRRHGNSGGEYCTYGFYEKHDVVRAVDYLLSRTDIPAGKIGIFGTSMGAAIGLQAASIDKRIAAVVAENSFATLRTIFDDYQRRMIKLSFHYLRNMVIVRSELTAKFKASDVSPLEAVKKIHLPLLFVYGTNDNLINFQYSLLLYEHAHPPKELFAVEGASHSNIWDIAGASYKQRLRDFYSKYLP